MSMQRVRRPDYYGFKRPISAFSTPILADAPELPATKPSIVISQAVLRGMGPPEKPESQETTKGQSLVIQKTTDMTKETPETTKETSKIQEIPVIKPVTDTPQERRTDGAAKRMAIVSGMMSDLGITGYGNKERKKRIADKSHGKRNPDEVDTEDMSSAFGSLPQDVLERCTATLRLIGK